jgi:hypothetical protein
MLFFLCGAVSGTRLQARLPAFSDEELAEVVQQSLLGIEAYYQTPISTAAELERTARGVRSNPFVAMVMTPIESLLKSSALLFPAPVVQEALSWWVTSPNGRERIRLIAEFTKKEFEAHADFFDQLLKQATAPGEPDGQ